MNCSAFIFHFPSTCNFFEKYSHLPPDVVVVPAPRCVSLNFFFQWRQRLKKLLLSVVGIKQKKNIFSAFLLAFFFLYDIDFASFISASDCVSSFYRENNYLLTRQHNYVEANKYSPLYFKLLQFILVEDSATLLLRVSELMDVELRSSANTYV